LVFTPNLRYGDHVQRPPRKFEGEIQLEPPTVKSSETVPAVEDHTYLGFIASALVISIAGGFLLAVLLPLAEAGTFGWESRVPQLIQAHGWAQLQGWTGLFVAGMSMRLIPRFAGRPGFHGNVTLPILALLVPSVVVRTVVEPFVGGATGDVLTILAGVSGGLGMLGVSTVLCTTLIKGRKRREPWRYFAWAGAAWWAAWAAFAVGAALKSVGNDRYVPASLDDALTWVVIFGCVGNFVFGVQSRSVPVFFGRKTPAVGRVLIPGLMLNAGPLLIALSLLPLSGAASFRLEGAGLAVAGLAVAWLAPIAGSVYGTAHRLRPRSRAASRYVLGANITTIAGGLCLTWAGLHTLTSGSYEAYAFRDAARHAFGIGMITMLALGMAQLVAPVFALSRAEPRPPGMAERLPFWLLVGAVVLRMSTGLLADHVELDVRMRTAAVAGALAWLALVLFATTVVRAIRNEPRMKRLMADAARTGAFR
jgi:hypothetical protein